MEDSERYSKEILERIREMAKRHGGEMSVVYAGGGIAGTGCISFGWRQEVCFAFSFTNSGYSINAQGEHEQASIWAARSDYGDPGGIEQVIDMLEREISGRGYGTPE